MWSISTLLLHEKHKDYLLQRFENCATVKKDDEFVDCVLNP